MNNDNKLASMNDYFKLPIFYNTKKVQLKENVIKDLELVETVDPSANSITTFFLTARIVMNLLTQLGNKHAFIIRQMLIF